MLLVGFIIRILYLRVSRAQYSVLDKLTVGPSPSFSSVPLAIPPMHRIRVSVIWRGAMDPPEAQFHADTLSPHHILPNVYRTALTKCSDCCTASRVNIRRQKSIGTRDERAE